MLHLTATLHTLGITLRDRARAATSTGRERGSVTIQEVLWAVFAIALVGIVVAAIRAYVTAQAANIT
jgi:hypothetical protein